MEAARRGWIPASRYRLLLAIYLDFILFSTIWAVLVHAATAFYPEIERWDKVLRFVLFGAIEFLLQSKVRWSPGNWLLGIGYVSREESVEIIEYTSREQLATVDPSIKARESWLTILLGVLFLSDGLKSIVRWTMWTPPIPLFGTESSPAVSAAVLSLYGACGIAVGAGLLRLRKEAFYGGIALVAAMLVNVAASWPLWDPWCEEMIRLRRAYQGLAVRPGEAARLQAIVPEALVAGGLLFLTALFSVRKRLAGTGSGRNAP